MALGGLGVLGVLVAGLAEEAHKKKVALVIIQLQLMEALNVS
jgi:hypothetical protein